MFELSKKDQATTASDAEPNQSTQRPAGNTSSSANRSKASSSEVAVIGRSIQIDGELRGEEDLRIDGNVSGTIQLPNHSLTIGPDGKIEADVYAKSITVDGQLSGDMYGSECVSISKKARVTGNILATRVSLEEGANFKGSIDMDQAAVEAALKSKASNGAQASSPLSSGKPVVSVRSMSSDQGSGSEPAH